MRQHSCIVLRHLCYVGRHVSVQCDDTPALCYGTSITWACTSLLSATTLLLVLRHFYYVGRYVSVQCDGTPALCYDTSVTWACTSLFSTVPYIRVPIVLHPSYSLLLVYTCKHLYDKNLNNEQEESIRNQFCYVMYLRVPSIQNLCSELL